MSSIEISGIDHDPDRILMKKLKQFNGEKFTFDQKFPELKQILDFLVNQGKSTLPVLRILSDYDKYQNGNFIYISSDFGNKKNCILHPLAFAIRQGHEELIEMLMETKIDFNTLDDCGLTLIHHAAYDSTGSSIKSILKSNFDCNTQDFIGNAVLHHACRNGNFKVVELLSSTNNIDFNVKDNNGTTAIHVACIRGHVDIVKHFINHKLNIKLNVTDNQGFTPFHHACHQGYQSNLGIVQLILHHFDQFLIDAPNNLGMTPFHLASFYGQKHIVEHILIQSNKIPININALTNDNDEKTAFHLACMRGHLNIVELFVDFARKKKVVLNGRNSRGETPFFNACFKGHTKIVSFLMKHAQNSIKINIPDCSGVTPLHIACRQGFEDIVELLLTENLINEEDTNGETPLHHACIEGHLEVVKLLLESCHINVNATNHALTKPLHLACYYGHPEVVKTLLCHPNIDKNAKLPNGATMFHVACASGDCEVVKLILDFGCLEATDDFGCNAFHYACNFNSSAELTIFCFETFKNNKKILYATDNNGRTPLQLLLLQSSCQVILNELKEYISDPCIQIDIEGYQKKENLIRKREFYTQSIEQNIKFKSCKNWFHKQF